MRSVNCAFGLRVGRHRTNVPVARHPTALVFMGIAINVTAAALEDVHI